MSLTRKTRIVCSVIALTAGVLSLATQAAASDGAQCGAIFIDNSAETFSGLAKEACGAARRL